LQKYHFFIQNSSFLGVPFQVRLSLLAFFELKHQKRAQTKRSIPNAIREVK